MGTLNWKILFHFSRTATFHWKRKIHRKKMKLAFLLGFLSVTMVMGKTAKLAEMAKMTKMADYSGDQRAAAERMDEEDAMEKRQEDNTERSDLPTTCDPGWISNSDSTCKNYEDNNWCTQDGSYGTGWRKEFDNFQYWADDSGRSALVCPQCGCGKNGAMRQFFIVNKWVDCKEAENVCKSQEAQLMSVKSFNGLKSKEKELLKRYVKSQYDSIGERTMNMWVVGSLAGSSSNGSSSNRMCKRLYVSKNYADIYGPFESRTNHFPLCETTVQSMNFWTPTMAPPKVPVASGQFFVIYKQASCKDAVKMCQAKGAKLANVETGTDRTSQGWFRLDKSEWSADRLLLKKYLDLQRELIKNAEFKFVRFWVRKGYMMYMGTGISDGQIQENWTDVWGGRGRCSAYGWRAWPVCQITL